MHHFTLKNQREVGIQLHCILKRLPYGYLMGQVCKAELNTFTSGIKFVKLVVKPIRGEINFKSWIHIL